MFGFFEDTGSSSVISIKCGLGLHDGRLRKKAKKRKEEEGKEGKEESKQVKEESKQGKEKEKMKV